MNDKEFYGSISASLEQQPFERSLKTDRPEMAMTFIPFEGSALRPKTDTLLHPSNYYTDSMIPP